MKKFIIFLLCLTFSGFIFSQGVRGVSAADEDQKQVISGDTYAIVIGISNYRYIKPLTYADNDADLFADFLRSKAGGSIKDSNLVVLKNEAANSGNITTAFTRFFKKNFKAGDRVYIYFAGHGDAAKDINEYYLLLSDCQPAGDANNYWTNNSVIDVLKLKNRISLLTRKDVDVVLIMDACRSNELPGGYASQVFYTSVAQMPVKGAIMMLATGAGEVSIEDKTFGNGHGHGLFTYKLIDGLSGPADMEVIGNNDGKISLKEIQQWVSVNVSNAARLFKTEQEPSFCCEDKNRFDIARVDTVFREKWLAMQRDSKKENIVAYNKVKTARSSDGAADSNLVSLYNKFNTSRKENKLWGAGSANEYFDQMVVHYPSEAITEDAKYALAADFITFAQQKINLYLDGRAYDAFDDNDTANVKESFVKERYSRLKITASEKWTRAAFMLQKALDLLSKDEPALYGQLKPKINFLLARGYFDKDKENKLTYKEALACARDAYRADSKAAYLAHALALINKDADSSFFYEKRAIDLAPKWEYPYNSMSLIYKDRRKYDSALYYVRQAIALNPKNGNPYNTMGTVFEELNQYDSALYYYRLSLKLRPNDPQTNKNVGEVFEQSGMLDSALFYMHKAININSEYNDGFFSLGYLYHNRYKSDSAYYYYKKTIIYDQNNAAAYNNLGNLYDYDRLYDSAITCYKLAIQVDSTDALYYDNLGIAFSKIHSYDSALYYYKRAIIADPKKYKVYDRITDIYRYNLKVIDSAYYYYDKWLFLTQKNEVTYLEKITDFCYNEKLYGKAIYNCKRLLRADPENGWGLYIAGLIYQIEPFNNKDSAIFYFTKSLNVKYRELKCLKNIGYIFLSDKKDHEKAVEYFTLAITSYPDKYEGYYGMASYYSKQGNAEKSLEFLAHALEKARYDYEGLDTKYIIKDENLNFIKNNKEFIALLEKYANAR